ncbi:unnamed protein product [Closterium sp. NIES-54]
MDVWGPARVSGQGRKRYFLLVVDDYTRYTTVFPLHSKGQVVDVLIPSIRTVRLQLRKRFRQDLPVLCLHSDIGGKFSSDLLGDFCHGEGILQSFTLPESPRQNGIAERRIGLVMEFARTSMVHAAAPHFLWPFAVRYVAHQLNLRPRISLPENSPTLRWTGDVGDASVFRVWGSRAFVRDTYADKLPARAIPCGPAPSGVSQVDPLPGTAPVEVAVGSSAARGAACGGSASRGAEPGGGESEGAGSRGAEPGVEEPGGAEPAAVEPGGAEPEGVESRGAESEGAESGGAEPRGSASSGGLAGASPRLSPQPLREWLVRRAHLRNGATGVGGAGNAGAGGAGVTTGAGGTRGSAAAGPGGARTRGAGAAGTGGVGGAGDGDPTEPGATGAGGSCTGGTGTGGDGAGGAGVGRTGAGGAGAAGAGAVDPGAGGAGGTVQPRPYFVPLLQQVFCFPSSTSLTPPLLYPLPDHSQPPLLSASPLPAPSPYIEQSGGLTEGREPASRAVSPVPTARRVTCSRPPLVPGTHAMALRPSSVPLCVPLPAPPESSLPEVHDLDFDGAHAASATVYRLLATADTNPSFESAVASALVAELLDFAATYRLDYATALVTESASASPPSVGGECALGMNLHEDRQEDFECVAAAVLRFASMLLALEGDPDAPDIPTTRSYAEAITGFIQRQGVDFFHTFSPTPKMTSLWAPREWHDTLRTTFAALGFAPSIANPSLFLRTDTSLPPFYVLVYVDDLVFATADTEALTLVKSELQKRHACTDLGELCSNLGLQITRDRARCTITLTSSHMVHQVLQRFGFQFSSPQPTPLSTSHSLSAPPSDESVEPSGPNPELVGCLIYLMTCTRPVLAYPLSLLARYVAPGRHRKVHWDAAKRVLRYLCSTSGMGVVLGGRGPVVITGHATLLGLMTQLQLCG